jgi:hypothetical protein
MQKIHKSPLQTVERLRTRSHEYNELHWSADVLQTLNAMRLSKELCDLTVHVGGVDFHCHRIVLAAACPYFRAVFRHSQEPMEKRSIEVCFCESVPCRKSIL